MIGKCKWQFKCNLSSQRDPRLPPRRNHPARAARAELGRERRGSRAQGLGRGDGAGHPRPKRPCFSPLIHSPGWVRGTCPHQPSRGFQPDTPDPAWQRAKNKGPPSPYALHSLLHSFICQHAKLLEEHSACMVWPAGLAGIRWSTASLTGTGREARPTANAWDPESLRLPVTITRSYLKTGTEKEGLRPRSSHLGCLFCLLGGHLAGKEVDHTGGGGFSAPDRGVRQPRSLKPCRELSSALATKPSPPGSARLRWETRQALEHMGPNLRKQRGSPSPSSCHIQSHICSQP